MGTETINRGRSREEVSERKMVVFEDISPELILCISLQLENDADAVNFSETNKEIRASTTYDMKRRRWRRLGLVRLCNKGDVEGVRYMMSISEAEDMGPYTLSDCLWEASRNGNVEIMKAVGGTLPAQLPIDKKMGCRQFLSTAGRDFFDPFENAMITAASGGHLEAMKYLTELDGGRNADIAFHVASDHGHLELVQYLVTVPGVDPSSLCNQAIGYASWNGHVEVVKFLAGLEGVNPSDNDNFALRIAMDNGREEVVRFLIGVTKAPKSEDVKHAILRAKHFKDGSMEKYLEQVLKKVSAEEKMKKRKKDETRKDRKRKRSRM